MLRNFFKKSGGAIERSETQRFSGVIFDRPELTNDALWRCVAHFYRNGKETYSEVLVAYSHEALEKMIEDVYKEHTCTS